MSPSTVFGLSRTVRVALAAAVWIGTTFARPKSSTFTKPASDTITLPGFRSRCTMPAAWAAASAPAIWMP
jgi:hypothetical protein